MKKLLQAASVASLVLFGAVGCSNCCGSRTTSAAAPCANGQCATPTTTGRMMTSGMSGTASPTTITAMPGRPSAMPVSTMPATGAMTTTSGSPMLMPQN